MPQGAKSRRKIRNASDINRPLLLPASIKPNAAPVPPPFESLNVSKEQCSKAIDALISHAAKKLNEVGKSQLLDIDESVELVVTLKRIPAHPKVMPIKLPVTNPILNPKESPVCLLVKDPQRQYKDLLVEKKVSFISRVVGVTKLQGKFKTFEARRHLMAENDFFLVDDRIVPMLPKLLGKKWIESKKAPIPVCLTRIDLKAELERALTATYLQIGRGSCQSVKIGQVKAHEPKALLENLVSILPHLAIRLPEGGWSNVQSLHIKTTTSIALPIWTCPLDESAPSDALKASGRFWQPPVDESAHKGKRKRLVHDEAVTLDEGSEDGKGSPPKKAKGTTSEVPEEVEGRVEELLKEKKKASGKERKVEKEDSPRKRAKVATPQAAEVDETVEEPQKEKKKKVKRALSGNR